jgi:hypothetical protein
MNISTGGPHILLFERDQQLAALLMSELQLTGYEGHTARTAVEVFDAIARYPVRLVLVNLAQAAAARREFWVALDTQRRGGNIQVLTFHCTNLAGYGPHDVDEHLPTVADIEVDGMMGMMKLIDVVRARIPSSETSVNTVPRMVRTSSAASAVAPRFTQPLPVPNISNNTMIGGAASSRNPIYDEGNGRLSASRASAAAPLSHPSTSVTPVSPAGPSPVSQVHYPSQMPSSSAGDRNAQTAHPEKIRAVIYPNQQRSWNTPTAISQETSQPSDATTYAPSTFQASGYSVSDTPVLRGLANGQLDELASRESGLAQLTRMVQESQVPTPVSPVQTVSSKETYVLPAYAPSTARVGSASEAISSQSLRPSPIQGLPEERPVTTSSSSTDGQRRPEVLSRVNYNQSSAQIPSSAAQSPLASIAASGMTTNSTSTSAWRDTVEDTERPVISKDTQKGKEDLATQLLAEIGDGYLEEETEAQPTQEYTANSSSESRQEGQEEQQQDDSDGASFAKNSVILDILQSLPPMPTIGQQQAIQPQVLNGRVTRSLGSVLLDGHLVPQERLEVAQNIQRMLRGVDLNYQLGEILLMFKLLTPDQLLAASLVSYGLITTTQISAFGRIRQELHSIGLEYDLENLLVLFRILTPEQLREARSNIQN